MDNLKCVLGRVLAISPLAFLACAARGQCPLEEVVLQTPTASFTQDCGGYTPAGAIDTNPATAWALGRCSGGGDTSRSETLVFETRDDFGGPGLTRLVVDLFSGGAFSGTNLSAGRLLISYTQANRDTFANGLAAGGQLGAEWTPLVPTIVLASRANASGVTQPANAQLDPTATIGPDGTVLIGGPSPEFANYTIIATVPSGVVRGLRFDFIDSNGTSTAPDGGLPTGGPGRHANGNMLLRTVAVRQSRPLSILIHPESGRVCSTRPWQLSVTADGRGPLTYQWYRDGAVVDGATTAFYVTSVPGRYNVRVQSSCDFAVSEDAVLEGCLADVNCDQFVDFFDYNEFVELYQLGDIPSDANRDGFIDFFDYLEYTTAYQEGCRF
jgi:hypothetical protein